MLFIVMLKVGRTFIVLFLGLVSYYSMGIHVDFWSLLVRRFSCCACSCQSNVLFFLYLWLCSGEHSRSCTEGDSCIFLYFLDIYLFILVVISAFIASIELLVTSVISVSTTSLFVLTILILLFDLFLFIFLVFQICLSLLISIFHKDAF